MSNPEVANCILEIFEAACIELFQNISCEIKRVQNCKISTFDVPHASMDAGCHDVEIETHLYVPFTALAMTYPAQTSIVAISEVALEDWLCELNNLLMGKLKKRLYDYGIVITFGLPHYSINSGDNIFTSEGGEYFAIIFDVDKQLFEAGIFIEVFNDALVLSAQESIDAVADGELEFF